VEELVKASPTVGCVRGAHRDHLYVKGAHTTRVPGFSDRVAFQEPEETEALEAAVLEASRARPGTPVPRQKHVGPQRFVALLGPAADDQEGQALFHRGADGAAHLRSSVLSGFFFRHPPEAVRSFADAP
jgi:hypothetical protein